MRDYRDAKAMAQTLRQALKEKSVSLTHSESLELIAKVLGLADWNTLSARIDAAPKTGPTATLIVRKPVMAISTPSASSQGRWISPKCPTAQSRCWCRACGAPA